MVKYQHVIRVGSARAGVVTRANEVAYGVLSSWVQWDDAKSQPGWVPNDDLIPGEVGLPGDVVVWSPDSPQVHGRPCSEIFPRRL